MHKCKRSNSHKFPPALEVDKNNESDTDEATMIFKKIHAYFDLWTLGSLNIRALLHMHSTVIGLQLKHFSNQHCF